MLTFAQVGTGRLLVHLWPSLLVPRWHFNAVWFVPVAAVLVHDLVTRRRIHPVYLVGGVLFLLRINRSPFMRSEAWLPIGRALLRPFVDPS
jgi:hypothetical protein